MSALEEYRVSWPSHSMNEQRVYRFPNGYGASVVRGQYTYGGPALWELAVIKWSGASWEITYETPITSDVEGWLDDAKVEALLVEIAAL